MADPLKSDHPPPPSYPGTGVINTSPPPQYHSGPPPPQYGTPPMSQPQYAHPYPGQQPGMMNPPPPPPPGVMVGGPPQATVIVQQPMYGASGGYGPSPTSLNCPYCSASITTTTNRECGGMVWMIAGIICLIGLFFPLLWLGCCLIPFCIPSLYNTKHTCPNCQRILGTYRQAGM